MANIRQIDWDALWIKIAKSTALEYGETTLADQDIINTVIKTYPNLVYEVPCYWNNQLSYRTLSYDCYKANSIKVSS